MTVLAVLAVPGIGAALACDSRATVGTSILSDACDKFSLAGSAVALVAGADGGLMDAIYGAKGTSQLHAKAMEYTAGRDLDWNLLVYDRPSERILYLDSDGQTLPLGSLATGGCGGALARGYLAALKPPTSLQGARKAVVAAVRTACRHDAFCGGAIRSIVVPRKGKIQVF